MRSGAGGAVGLFLDWAAGTEHSPGPQALETFLTDVDLAASGVHAVRRWLGLTSPPPRASAVRAGDLWLEVGESVARCPRWGTAGVRGRRDAFVLTCLAAGLTRRELLMLRAHQVEGWTVAGRRLVMSEDWRSCPRCVLARWLQVLAVLPPSGSRLAARNLIATAPQPQQQDQQQQQQQQQQHECHADPPMSWRSAPVLLPALDQHGWPSPHPLTARSLTRLVAARMSVSAPVPFERTPPPPQARRVDRARLLQEIEELLDELEARLGGVDHAAPATQREAADAEVTTQTAATRSANRR